MIHFYVDSNTGYLQVGKFIFSWLNKFSHWEDGITSVTWNVGEPIEYAIDLDASGLTLVTMVDGDIFQQRSLITCPFW